MPRQPAARKIPPEEELPGPKRTLPFWVVLIILFAFVAAVITWLRLNGPMEWAPQW
jgi:hypothetical protein